MNLNKLKGEEFYAVSLSFIYYFCVLAAYYMIRPMRDQLAAEVGLGQLLWFFVATLIATLFLMPLFAWIVSCWPRRLVMPLVYLFLLVVSLDLLYYFITAICFQSPF